MGNLSLDTPVQYVKGVGPTRAQQLAKLGVNNVEELLTYFPRRFDLRKSVQPIAALRGDEKTATIAGEVTDVEQRRFGSRPYLQCCLRDDGGMVIVRWYHGLYLQDKVHVGCWLAVSGKVSIHREQIQFINPGFQIIYDAGEVDLDRDELLPVYPAGTKLSSRIIAGVIKRALPQAVGLMPRWFSRQYLAARGLPDRPKAIAAMHRPEDKEQWSAARRRLAYDECLVMQLGIALMRMREVSRPAYALPCDDKIDQRIRARFPFELTGAQNRAVSEIAADISRSRPMNRLVQGDVGSGKTVVALYAALTAVAAGKQAAVMAPTEIVARQHYQNIQTYLAGSRVKTSLLVGGQKTGLRQNILAEIADGQTDIVVGTHALIGNDVRFANLALVVVDEQHKFGVRQRTSFRGKGYAPHYLVMTATPIPRTLAMTVFGDLDVSVIDELPPHRGTTVTRCMSQKDMGKVMEKVRRRLTQGQQAYFVYPLVTPSPELELQAAAEAFEELSAGPLRDFAVGLIHGQMSTDKKNDVMKRFRSGQVQVLVASVVVEVGLDVPDANVMVIMHAERFGLAQLHQLRGRIGRASHDAECILVASPANPIAKQRLDVMEATSDGFKIAEEDLRIRGPGEFFGTRQHGLPELKVADLIEDFELLRMARRDAFNIVAEDPDLSAPHNQQLRREVLRAYAGKMDLLAGA